MLSMIPPQTLALGALVSLIVYYLIWTFYTLTLHPYARYPGPFLAKLTSWHRWYTLRYHIDANVRLPLHVRYGPIVRIAPDEVSIADPAAIDAISRRAFTKTDFYDNFDPRLGGRPEIFAERDERKHDGLKRMLVPLFRAESVAKYEGYIDDILGVFCDKMDERVGDTVDLAEWVARFSWDTVGRMVHSFDGGFGMLRDGVDFNGWMGMVRVMQWNTGQLHYVPFGFRTLYFVFQMLISGKTREGVLAAVTAIKQSRALIKRRKEREALGEKFNPDDMLSKMLRMEEDEKLDWCEDDTILTLNAFIWAGSDTTASTLGMITFFILRDQRVCQKLKAEIDAANVDGYMSYQTAAALPYLGACIHEGFRLHTIIGMGWPRRVPPGGAEICGQHFPGGYKVQLNHNVTHLDKSIYGEYAEEYRPERWIENDENTTIAMHRHLHTFGYGNRIAMSEIYKFIPTVLKRYRFDVLKEPWVSRGWFQQPEHFIVKVNSSVEH
ncbi:cytochrome P450 [Polyplosphaeria fusca]|uniref:Cytochrome P450 n=1 Tax=Polyplosphaeria fusca TaxID=682080 RepID=A0A9P4V2A6_9PLEO|nr:cytochrome P450 [Polyplosphaeria fusca]